MKKILLIILTLCATTTLFAQTFTDNGINYKVTSPTTVEVVNNRTFTGSAVIPSSVIYANVTYSVTKIDDYAFNNNPSLIALTLPNSVTSIGIGAFGSCTGLITLIIPNSVTNIGRGAFGSCTSLTSLSIPNSITNISENTFSSCKSLTTLNIPNSITSIGTSAFSNCTGISSIYIPNSVTNIGNYAFQNCESLTHLKVDWANPLLINAYVFNYVPIENVKLYVPAGNLALYTVAPIWKGFGNIIEGVLPLNFMVSGINYVVTSSTTVEVGANNNFQGEAVISSIVTYLGINYSVTSLGYHAFKNCRALTAITIPNTVTSIGDYALADCNDLISITIPNSVESIGDNAFSVCIRLLSLIIPNSVKSIGKSAFYYCTDITTISLPNSLTSIGYNAFNSCVSLTYLKVDWANPLLINANVFQNEQILSANLFVPSSTLAAYKAASVWQDFGNIVEGDLPLTFTASGINYTVTSPTTVSVASNAGITGAFELPSSVINMGITYTVTNLGANAFKNCTGLISITIPSTVKTIGGYAFYNCSGLVSVNIPNSITTIGSTAFSGCEALTSLNIPNSVTSIGEGAFIYCFGLKSVTVNWASPFNITSFEFGKVLLGSVTLYVPAGTLAAYQAAPVWKDFGTIIEMQPITFTYQGINFKVTSPTTIEITATPSFTGVLNIPSNITYEGITYDVTSIANNAFAGTDITTINIPSTVINIGDYAFANLTSLITVNINWTTPLVINANVFGDVPTVIGKMREPSKTILANTNITSATLYVLAGTLAAYKAAPVWKDFGTILEQFPLPLTLTSFTAKAIATGNQINWATANIINVKSIILERSGADKIFTAIASLPITANQFIDSNPLAGDNYYRLSTIDNDGSPITYSQIAFLKGLTIDVSFYPNPVTNGLLNVVTGSAKIYSVAMFNLNGKKVVFVNTKNSHNKIVVSTQGLVKGVYILEIRSEKGKTIKKVVVN